VEDVVAEIPVVAQVGVIGVPDEKWGEAVTAVVVLKPDASAELDTLTGQIQALVRERKGSVHVPKQVIIAESLPLTGLGKPDKKALRARYGG
jgi:fatty-acyl-CoA synthase